MTVNSTLSRSVDRRREPVGVRPGRSSRLAAGLALLLAATAALTSLLTLFDAGLLRGPAAMNGSARGTALTVVVVAVPLLVASVAAARRGSSLALLGWLGALGLLSYNALMFLFATPFNRLFLLYVAWLALAVWSIGTLLFSIDPADVSARVSPAAPVRGVAAYIWVVTALNALAWLAGIGPALVRAGPPAFLRGTGLTTNVAYVQDLALWLPLMAIAGVWLRQRRPWGLVLAGGGLVMWCQESVSVAVDQAYGAAADPTSSVASAAMTPVFLAVAAIGLVPILLLLRGFDGEGLAAKAHQLAPSAGGRPPAAWAFALVSLGVAMLAAWGGAELIHDGFGLPASWLPGTPFTSWTVPGLALLVGVTLPQAVAAGLVARGSAWARLAALVCGISLVVWIVVQILVLQHLFFLQPVTAAVGVLEIWLARRPGWAA